MVDKSSLFTGIRELNNGGFEDVTGKQEDSGDSLAAVE